MEQRTLKIGDRIIYCYEDGSVEYSSMCSGKICRTYGSDCGRGYKRIVLKINNKIQKLNVHRLIAKAFHPNPSSLPEVDHINRDKTDNRPCNLRWCNHKDNCNNKSIIDNALEKYGVRCCEDKKSYAKAYSKVHAKDKLGMIKPDGSPTSTGSLSPEVYDILKPLSQRDRYYKYKELNKSR